MSVTANACIVRYASSGCIAPTGTRAIHLIIARQADAKRILSFVPNVLLHTVIV